MSYKNVTLLRANSKLVLEKYNSKCAICGKDYEQIHHIDGTKTNHSVENLMPLCSECHVSTHNKNRESLNSNKINSKFIKKAILDMGLNRSEFADLLGMTPSSLSIMLKRGTTYVRTIRRLSEILKCNISDIMQPDSQISSFNQDKYFYLTINFDNLDYEKIMRHSAVSNSNPESILKSLLYTAVRNLKEPVLINKM